MCHQKNMRKSKEEIKYYRKMYSQTPKGKEALRKASLSYSKTTKGKEMIKRCNRKMAHKRRNLGFIELNDWFENSESHHIDRLHVIHIPKEMHKSINHNVWTGKRMDEINVIAFNYLLDEDLVSDKQNNIDIYITKEKVKKMAKGISDRNTYKKIRCSPNEKEDEYILNLEQTQRSEFREFNGMETAEGFRKLNDVQNDPFYVHNERVETKIYKTPKMTQKEINEMLKEDGVL